MDIQEESVVGISQNNHMIQIPREVLENTNRPQGMFEELGDVIISKR